MLLVLKTNRLYMLVVVNPKYYLEGSSLIPIVDNLPDDNNNNNLVGLEKYQAFTKEIRVATLTHCLLSLFPLLRQVRLESVAFLLCCCSSSILLLLLLFQIATSSLPCFCRCGRNKFSKFNFFRLDLKVRVFSPPNVYLLMGCYLFRLSMFFWVILIDNFLFVV